MGNTEKRIDFQAFLASMAHDMKNSLGIVLGSLDDVVENCITKQCPCRNHLSQIKYEASRVNHNLIQLLTLYKVDNDQFDMNISHYHVADILEENILQNKSLLEYKGIEALTECDDDLTWFFDRDLLSGVINNVLNNSFRYTKDKVKIRAEEKDGWLILSIEDNGRGYPEEMLEKGAGASRGINFKTGSTGLGLYFASLVAKMHKNKGKEGFVTISNGGEYGGGCFTINLP
jgi:signal transduction histidine kinase